VEPSRARSPAITTCAGCRLVAGGVETEGEAKTILELGVEFGRDNWSGQPEPVRVRPSRIN
jgi:EAL domain-containing protein (putative c-di-GMP-specific phosphodiesterase class I)